MIQVIAGQSTSATTQPDSAPELPRRKPICQVGSSLIKTASEEYSIEVAGTQAWTLSSSHDPAEVVPGLADEDLLSHIRKTDWEFVQGTPSFCVAQTDHDYLRFRGQLVATLLDEPIEDGVTHPAEQVIDEALRTNSSECLDWLSQALVEHYPTRPSLCASIVRCIGRIDYERVREWGMHVVDDALRNKDTEVREAAIRGLEAWGGSVALGMLRRHQDPEAWLNEYVQLVIVDLSGTTS